MHPARRSHRAGLCLVLVHAAACVPEVDVELPATVLGAQSAIVIFEPLDGAAARGFGLDLREAVAEPFAVPARTRVTVLQHARTLRELDLVEGPLPAADGADTRGLPPSLVRHRAQLDGDVSAWRAILEDELPDVRLPPLYAEACVARAPEGDDELRSCLDADGACVAPCPDVERPVAPLQPAPITPSMAVECPSGWHLDAPTLLGGRFCVPDVAVDATTCPIGQVLSFAEGCVAVGRACPADPFGAVPGDAVRTYYVLPGASGTTGARGDPFGSLSQALAVVPDQSRLVLAKGEHDALALTGRHDLELFGACAAETIVRGAHALVDSTEIVVRDVTLEGRELVIASSLVELRDVAVRASERGLELSGTTTATLAGVSIFDGGPATAGGASVSVSAPAVLVMRSSAIEAPRGRGVAVVGAGASAELDAVFVGRAGATAISASEGAAITGGRVAIVAAAGSAIDARGAGTTVVLDHLFVHGAAGAAISAVDGAHADLGWTRVERASDSAIHVARGASLSLSDALILEHLSQTSTVAMHVTEASAALERVLFETFGGRALRCVESVLVASDLGIAAGAPIAETQEGLLVRGGRAEVHRLLIRGARGQAIDLGVDKPDRVTDATLEDVLVTGTRGSGSDRSARAVVVGPATTLVLRRARIEDSALTALDVEGLDAVLDAEDLTIIGTPYTGLSLRRASTTNVARLVVEDARSEAVVLSSGASAEPLRATLGDVVVRSLAGGVAPTGFLTIGDVDAQLVRFHFDRLDVALDVGGEVGGRGVRISDGLVERTPTGLRVLPGIDAHEAADALERVRFRDVDLPFERR